MVSTLISRNEASKVIRIRALATAARLRAVFVFGGLLAISAAGGVVAADRQPPPSVNGNAQAKASSPAPKPQTAARPLWTELTPAQQQALAPLATEWDKLDGLRKTKWLAIGNKYASMSPDEQQRVQERMRDWVKLTPEQRRVARESYARAKKLNRDQKSAQWQQYQQLPEEQKKKLAADSASKKHVATLPSASQSKAKPVPPIKSAPKPVLEKSVTPEAANQSVIQAGSQPANK
jgi:hypothetical protein